MQTRSMNARAASVPAARAGSASSSERLFGPPYSSAGRLCQPERAAKIGQRRRPRVVSAPFREVLSPRHFPAEDAVSARVTGIERHWLEYTKLLTVESGNVGIHSVDPDLSSQCNRCPNPLPPSDSARHRDSCRAMPVHVVAAARVVRIPLEPVRCVQAASPPRPVRTSKRVGVRGGRVRVQGSTAGGSARVGQGHATGLRCEVGSRVPRHASPLRTVGASELSRTVRAGARILRKLTIAARGTPDPLVPVTAPDSEVPALVSNLR
mmetsp:Transcript_15602/g.32104  ORF Transcript_15602/g.32104 Transcript_15602/m.32104 type:complete len:266 (-) Transcript_15602:201-998(-)